MTKLKRNFDPKSISKKIETKLKSVTKQVALKWLPKLIKRAQDNHKYKNRTWQLTNTTNGIWDPFRNVITLFAPAQSESGYYYGLPVARRTKNFWLKASITFYGKQIKNDLLAGIKK